MSAVPTFSPFKLLQAYGAEDQRFFYGRERETRQLYDALLRTKFMLIYGASGTGKTSLIQCGLPGMFSPRDWMPLIIRRGADFLSSIRESLQQRYQELFDQHQAHYQKWFSEEQLSEPPPTETLRDLIRALFNLSYVPVYLVLDQFEELFTLGNQAEQQAFFSALAELDLFSEDLFCKILLVTREEYIAHFYRFEQQLPFLFEHRFRVEKMRDQQLLGVVRGTLTASYVGYPRFELEEKGGQQILQNLTDQRGEIDLTTLQVYLDRLYQEGRQRLKGRDYLLFDVELVGEHKIENVLANFLDKQVKEVSQSLRREVDLPLQVLFQLVTDEGTKRSLNATEVFHSLQIGKAAATIEWVHQCLEAFAAADSRLLNRLQFAKEEAIRYEIVHDQLAEQIFQKFSAGEIRRREAITTIANKRKRFIEASSRKIQRQEYLSMGELELIQQSLRLDILASGQPELAPFFEASQQYHQQRRQRERLVALVSGIAAIIFLVVAILAVQFSITARRAQKQEESERLDKEAALTEAKSNLKQFYLSEYQTIVTRADTYRALNDTTLAYNEYRYAQWYRDSLDLQANTTDSVQYWVSFYERAAEK